MTKDQLVQKLKDMRSEGEDLREMGAMTVLFGILFDHDIRERGTNAAHISEQIGRDLNIEINYGRQLAQYVTANPDVRGRWRRSGDDRRR